ncbi:ATP-dependent RNA helicase DDX25-like isoform X1 [Cervus elaphus]|uniref:ATP-dependent RNA helicase DDX25-like isoform X1 n=1 Tax=Cervus elaphus TaxID=9860 RepID=UPI001CC28897|nr:ATP-dependent RNA helicase DDX25-like isoform X1 [Cervus elaphus]
MCWGGEGGAPVAVGVGCQVVERSCGKDLEEGHRKGDSERNKTLGWKGQNEDACAGRERSWWPQVDPDFPILPFSNLIHSQKNLLGIKSATIPNTDGSVDRIEEDDEDDVVDLAANSLLNKLIRQSLVESSHRVEVLQKDPSSPLYSVKTFEELRLKEELLKGIYAMGFNRPSKIQEMALPMMLAHPPQNLIAQSQSGTGKTAAFVLAMLSRVNALNLFPQCLCLAPTYELALQTGRVVERMGKFCVDVQVMYAIRGNRSLTLKNSQSPRTFFPSYLAVR